MDTITAHSETCGFCQRPDCHDPACGSEAAFSARHGLTEWPSLTAESAAEIVATFGGEPKRMTSEHLLLLSVGQANTDFDANGKPFTVTRIA